MPRITKLLVANRGEIAVRIFRACRELGVTSVAIYSEIDRDAYHLAFADEAHYVGDTPPAESYLNVERILSVARRSGAGAVHPGYGFLAENPDFARAVIDAGLVWVGPPPEAVAAMGDKVAARRVAAAAGVATVPGTLEPAAGPEAIETFAGQYGWPVAVKAIHGGGGRGFRVVRSAGEAAVAFESAAREAGLAFGNRELYLERYLERPRHVEIQVLGDAHGHVLHLGERECSLQRRHQKLIEESPSPVVGAELREEMGAAAVKLCVAAGYSSAGTAEFLLEQTDRGPRFWFLELNTRLQVEHPVTEMVTGLDLVKEMIWVAEGRPLSFTQDDVDLRGHAIECRVNVEDPARNFMPSPGTITAYREPGGPGVRVDAGAGPGQRIPEFYDSLVAKLICYGSDREEAIQRMGRALDEFRIEGVATTLPFHRLVAASEWFRRGDFSTSTVEQSIDLSVLPPGQAPPPREGRARDLTIELSGKRFEVRLWERPGAHRARPTRPDPGARAGRGGVGETIKAPMQGTILRTLVEEGATVRAGDPILVLEAMKMENVIVAQRDGQIRTLRVSAGDSVQLGAALVVIAPPD
ncbi:MAG TPA: acetyl-CoA carboxylase biotin carboxylase subunit [Actinomycetota bacterium]|nr:acetyl-CoA carboxylase biotin carboxylase subunit [Actinomycetota bacterium]